MFMVCFDFLSDVTPPECDADLFRCLDAICIDRTRVCDGSDDCADSSDEYDCDVPVTCNDDEFLCGGASPMCIARMRVCDDVRDCQDGSDESHDMAGCAGELSWKMFLNVKLGLKRGNTSVVSLFVAAASSLGGGVIAGIVLACLVFFIILILLVGFVFFRRRRQKRKPPSSPSAVADTLSTIAFPESLPRPSNGLPLQPPRVLFNQPDATHDDAPPPYRPTVKDDRGRGVQNNNDNVQIEHDDNQAMSQGSWQASASQRVAMPAQNRHRPNHRSLPSRHRRTPPHHVTSHARNVDRIMQANESIYIPRKYVPDPTENPGRFKRSQSLVPERSRPLPRPPSTFAAYPPRGCNTHRGIKLGTTSLHSASRTPRNYMNQARMCDCDSDSVVTNNEHIYETLNLPSDSDNQSRCGSTHTLNHAHAHAGNRMSSASQHNPHLRTLSASSGEVFVRSAADASQTNAPASQLGPGFRHHSAAGSFDSTAADVGQGLSQTHARMLYPHTEAISRSNNYPDHATDVIKDTPCKTSKLYAPRFSLTGQNKLGRSDHTSSAFTPQAGSTVAQLNGSPHQPGPSNLNPALPVSWQHENARDLTTPDSLSKLIPSSNNSSFDQTAHAHQPAVVFLSDAQSLLMNPTSV